MRDAVRASLVAVHRRRRWRSVLRGALIGLVAGSLAGLALAVVRSKVAPFVPAAAALCGAAFGAARRLHWRDTAALIDDGERLKGRAVAALEFSQLASPGSFHQLQIRDALQHLGAIDARRVVPLRPPRWWPAAVGAAILAVVLGVWLWPNPPARAVASAPPDAVLTEADKIEANARKLAIDADELQSPELKQLAETMHRTAEALRKPGVDTKEALAQISALQAEIARQMKELDAPRIGQEMQNLGKALDAAKPFQEAGKALQKGELESAAKAMEKAQNAKVDGKDARAAEQKLREVARNMTPPGQKASQGLQRLSKSTSQLADGVKGDRPSMERSTQDLAKQMREQQRRKRINELMAREQQRLNDCKSECEARNLMQQRNQQSPPKSGGKKPDGAAGAGQSSAGPREARGRNQQELKGQAGDGPAQTEEEKGDPNDAPPAGGPAAPRPSREVYQKYKQMSEAALDNEPIPLGHRQTIRRYFELIRPSNDGDRKGP